MKDWAIKYILEVLERKDWNANQLAERAGVSTSTITRPLKAKNYAHKLSRTTIHKIRKASGIDPAPFIPDGFEEDTAMFGGPRPITVADKALRSLDENNSGSVNDIKIGTDGKLAQVVATVDKNGLKGLIKKLQAMSEILDD